MIFTHGSKFCFVVFLVINQITALLSHFTMLSAYCTIACTLARQSCPTAFLWPYAGIQHCILFPAQGRQFSFLKICPIPAQIKEFQNRF
jgi:hypothetical protein